MLPKAAGTSVACAEMEAPSIAAQQLRRVKFTDGTLICLEDFILLNENEAEGSHFVIVIEVENTNFLAPHFVFFSEKSTRNCTVDDFSYICQLCIQKWPKFQKIIDTTKRPIGNEDYTLCLNESKVHIAPRIEYFDIKEKNDLNYSNPYTSPIGCQIVRDK